jgi:hypothetical protein
LSQLAEFWGFSCYYGELPNVDKIIENIIYLSLNRILLKKIFIIRGLFFKMGADHGYAGKRSHADYE